MTSEQATAMGKYSAQLTLAELRIQHAWRVMAEATAPGRLDRLVQYERAKLKIREASGFIAHAQQLAQQLGDALAQVDYRRMELWDAQLRAVGDCWRRHQGEAHVPPIVCICATRRAISDYCEADHAALDEARFEAERAAQLEQGGDA